MSLKHITLRINNNKETVETVQIVGGEGGVGAQGQAVHIQAQANVHYHFTDEATGFGPENIATKRAGKDLYIAFEGGDVDQPDLVIEGYYKDDGEIGYAEGSNNMLIGTHENGDVYPYVPESAQTSDAVSMLADGVMAGQALGGSQPFVVPLFWLPLLAAGILGAALAGGGGGGGSTPVPPPNHEPEISGLTPEAQGGDAIVYEKALANGSDPSADGLRGNGIFTIKSLDGVKSLTIGGVTFIADGKLVASAKLTTPFGNELTVTGYDPATGVVSYSYLLTGNQSHPVGDDTNSLFESLSVVLTDNDGDKATNILSVQIVDDVPVANPDVDSVAAYQDGPATGNVLTGNDVASGDANDTDGVADVPGADGVTVVGVAKGNTNAALDQPATVGVALEGDYGTLTLNADGSYSYERKEGTAGGGDDVFTYTIKDGDGDLAHTTLTISLEDSTPEIADLTPEADGGDVVVKEEALAHGSNPASDEETAEGTFTVTSLDGIQRLTVGGEAVITDGTFAAVTITTPLGNELAITGYDPTTGVVTYTYTLLDNEEHPVGDGANSLFEHFEVVLTDNDGDEATNTLSVQIVDDEPTANVDTNEVSEDDIITDGDVLGNDVFGADGSHPDGAVVGVTTGNDTTTPVSGNIGTDLEGTYGTLRLNADGSYTYAPNAAAQALNTGESETDSFVYTIRDGDDDLSTATLTITITGANDVPEEDVEHSTLTAAVSEEGLSYGIKDTDGDTDTTDEYEVKVMGGIKFTDVDNAADAFTIKFTAPTDSFTSGGQTINWEVNDGEIVGSVGVDTEKMEVIRVTVGDVTADPLVTNGFKADYTVTLSKPLDHTVANVEDALDLAFGFVVNDGTADSAPQTLTVSVEDDSPFVSTVFEAVGVSSSFYANVMISLDVSGSMAVRDTGIPVDPANPGGQQMTRLEAAVEAINTMLDTYQAQLDGVDAGEVRVNLSTFQSTATQVSRGWVTIAAAKGLLGSLTADGGTNYDAALQELLDNFNASEYGSNAPIDRVDVNNLSYFLTDGAPTLSNYAPIHGRWYTPLGGGWQVRQDGSTVQENLGDGIQSGDYSDYGEVGQKTWETS